jgi:hypothetical protein
MSRMRSDQRRVEARGRTVRRAPAAHRSGQCDPVQLQRQTATATQEFPSLSSMHASGRGSNVARIPAAEHLSSGVACSSRPAVASSRRRCRQRRAGSREGERKSHRTVVARRSLW